MPDAHSQFSDQDLLDSARAGDADALDVLVRRHLPAVERFSWKLCREPEDAADVSQETLIAATGNIERFRSDSTFGSWLYAIARNFCIKKRRRGKFAPIETESVDRLSSRDLGRLALYMRTPEDDVVDNETSVALEQAILELDPLYRDVLILRDLQGIPAGDAAEMLGLNVHTVKTRLHRARRMLRDRVAHLLDIPS